MLNLPKEEFYPDWCSTDPTVRSMMRLYGPEDLEAHCSTNYPSHISIIDRYLHDELHHNLPIVQSRCIVRRARLGEIVTALNQQKHWRHANSHGCAFSNYGPILQSYRTRRPRSIDATIWGVAWVPASNGGRYVLTHLARISMRSTTAPGSFGVRKRSTLKQIFQHIGKPRRAGAGHMLFQAFFLQDDPDDWKMADSPGFDPVALLAYSDYLEEQSIRQGTIDRIRRYLSVGGLPQCDSRPDRDDPLQGAL